MLTCTDRNVVRRLPIWYILQCMSKNLDNRTWGQSTVGTVSLDWWTQGLGDSSSPWRSTKQWNQRSHGRGRRWCGIKASHHNGDSSTLARRWRGGLMMIYLEQDWFSNRRDNWLTVAIIMSCLADFQGCTNFEKFTLFRIFRLFV